MGWGASAPPHTLMREVFEISGFFETVFLIVKGWKRKKLTKGGVDDETSSNYCSACDWSGGRSFCPGLDDAHNSLFR